MDIQNYQKINTNSSRNAYDSKKASSIPINDSVYTSARGDSNAQKSIAESIPE